MTEQAHQSALNNELRKSAGRYGKFFLLKTKSPRTSAKP